MAVVNVEQVVTAGLAATYAAASAGGDKVVPGESTFLHVKNASVGSINCTIATPGTVDGLAIGDRIVAVPAGADRFIYLPPALYRNSADGYADITWSATTSVTFAAVKV